MIIFHEHKNMIWGTFCSKCGAECSVLQSAHHPWDQTTFGRIIRCSKCGSENHVNQQAAAYFYNQRIYSYFNELSGVILDLGCGGGFISSYLLNQQKINLVFGLDQDKNCALELTKLLSNHKFTFIHADICKLHDLFAKQSIDYLVSRDVFMFIEDTDRYFDDISLLVKSGIRQMGWYMKNNPRMRNSLEPDQILGEYRKRGWHANLKDLEWYKSGYMIQADRQ